MGLGFLVWSVGVVMFLDVVMFLNMVLLLALVMFLDLVVVLGGSWCTRDYFSWFGRVPWCGDFKSPEWHVLPMGKLKRVSERKLYRMCRSAAHGQAAGVVIFTLMTTAACSVQRIARVPQTALITMMRRS